MCESAQSELSTHLYQLDAIRARFADLESGQGHLFRWDKGGFGPINSVFPSRSWLPPATKCSVRLLKELVEGVLAGQLALLDVPCGFCEAIRDNLAIIRETHIKFAKISRRQMERLATP